MRVEPIDFNTFRETTEKLKYSGIFTTENYPEIIEQIELFELGYYDRVVQFELVISVRARLVQILKNSDPDYPEFGPGLSNTKSSITFCPVIP